MARCRTVKQGRTHVSHRKDQELPIPAKRRRMTLQTSKIYSAADIQRPYRRLLCLGCVACGVRMTVRCRFTVLATSAGTLLCALGKRTRSDIKPSDSLYLADECTILHPHPDPASPTCGLIPGGGCQQLSI